MSKERNLVYDFLNLRVSARRDTLLDLGLLTLEEYRVEQRKPTAREQCMLAFTRAKERGLVEKLAEMVAQKKGKD